MAVLLAGGGWLSAQTLVTNPPPFMTTNYWTGPTSERINIVVFGDGYQSSEAALFQTHVTNVVLNYLFTIEPFLSYRSYHNVFSITTASVESGADHPSSSVVRDTYFDATFDTSGIARLLTLKQGGRVYSLLSQFLPAYDAVIVIVNDTTYGGSGGSVAVTSVNSLSPQIVIHEFGHSFGSLADEYDTYTPGYSPAEMVNCTAQTNRALVKWTAWIDATTPVPTPEGNTNYSAAAGLFEGCMYTTTNWFRPHYNSCMRSLGQPYGQINIDQLVKRFYNHTPDHIDPFRTFNPASTNLTFNGIQSLPFSVAPMQPNGHSLAVAWSLDGTNLTGQTATNLNLSTDVIGLGNHTLSCLVSDPTAQVRIYTNAYFATNPLQKTVRWTLSVQTLGSPVITTISSLPAGTVGVGYSQTLAATNGTPPYTWSVIGGALPGGLTFDATGLLSGTPTAAGAFNFTAQVTDAVSATTNGNFALTINPALALLSAVSRKTHGASGTFDLPLMFDPTSNATVEPRLGGPTTLIFNFNTNVAAAGGVLDAGSFSLTNVTYSAASISSSNLTLNLTNAVDQSQVSVVLSGITDLAGNPLSGTNAVRIRSLYGDVNQSGTVNAVDLQQVKNNLLATLTPANFLCDINCSGTINAVDLQQIKNNLLHTASLSSGGSGLVVSGLSMTPALAAATLGEALGATNLTWSTNGDAVWTPTIAADGSPAAWSGHIGNLNVSWVETTVTGPGTLGFDWMVSSELNGDFLTFSIDGVNQPGAISGEVGWQTLTFSIPAGTHRLTWTYAKNAANAAGLDAGWLRRVVYR